MTVHQFGGEADVVRHDGPHSFLVEAVGTRATQPHAHSAGREKRVPERIILIYPQPPRDADGLYSVRCNRSLLKEQFVFLLEHIHPFATVLAAVRIDPLAVVAGEITLTVSKVVTAHLAVVLTPRTNLLRLLKTVGFQYLI